MEFAEGGLMLAPCPPGHGLQVLPALRVKFVGMPPFGDPERGPGTVAPRSDALVAAALAFEEAARVTQGFGQDFLGQACVPRDGPGLRIARFPCAFQEEKEETTLVRATVPPRLRSCGTSPAAGRLLLGSILGHRWPLGLNVPPLFQWDCREADGAFAGTVALAAPAGEAPATLGDEAKAGGDIGVEARTAFLVAFEQGDDAAAVLEEGFGRLIGIAKAEKSGVRIHPQREGGEEVLPSPHGTAPRGP
jgi:hypothetical protein